jgi:hypothetical protein
VIPYRYLFYKELGIILVVYQFDCLKKFTINVILLNVHHYIYYILCCKFIFNMGVVEYFIS